MLALARYTLKGPYHATSVVGSLAIVAVFIIPVMGITLASVALTLVCNMLAAILVGLIILTQGSGSGLKAIVIAVLGLSLMTWFGFGSATPGLSALLHWLPIIALAQVLRSSNSLALTLLAGIGICCLVIGLQYLYWEDLEISFFNQLIARPDGVAPPDSDQQNEILARIRLMMLFLASGLYLMSVLIVLVARWLQAKLADSQGFGQEFRALSLGKPAALAAVLVVPLGLWSQQGWLLSIALVVMIAFMFQGIAVVHSRFATKKHALGLFVLYYVLLVVTLQITGALTAITGVVDNWLDFRKKPENRNNVN